MPLTEADLKSGTKMLEFLNGLETAVATMKSEKPSSVAEPDKKPVAQHAPGFCATPEACDTCKPYQTQAQAKWLEAKAIGRNDVLTKLNQAAIDLETVAVAQAMAARMAQVEAGEGDENAKLIIIRALNGELSVAKAA